MRVYTPLTLLSMGKLGILLAMLLIMGMIALGRIGLGIGGVGLVVVLLAALVRSAIRKRRLNEELAAIDAEFPSQPGK